MATKTAHRPPVFQIGRAVLARILARVVAPGDPGAEPAAAHATREDLVAYVARHLERLHVPGASLALVDGDQIVHLQGFGCARPGGAAPTPQTPFLVGSLTKSFTALAVMQFVEAGQIDLDAPVQHYLPWFRVADPAASAAMTVRHLLNQTSGLPQLPGVLLLADLDQRPGARERQARSLATLALSRPPGSAWEYSNLNYNLLGLIVEAVSGTSYEAYIHEHIFAPLEMRHSYTSRAEAARHGLAVGHRYWFAVPIPAPGLPVPRGSVPAGYLISSAQDMAQYLIAHLNGGRYRDAEILSPEGIAELHRAAAPIEMLGRPAGAYGMGWMVEDSGPRRIVWHDGVVPDFYAYMALVPADKKAVVLLVNANHLLMTFALREVSAGMGALLAGAQPDPVRLGAIPWVLRAQALVPLLQVVGSVAILRRARRWSRDPHRRPRQRDIWLRDLVRPLLPSLLVALPLVAAWRRRLLRMLLLFMPDCAWTSLVSACVAAVWIVLRTGLTIGLAQRPWLSRRSAAPNRTRRCAAPARFASHIPTTLH